MPLNDFDLALTRHATVAALRPEDLESMGKRASQMYLDQGTPLNDAIVKLAGACPGISPEQIRRVVEFANQSTFHSLFEKQAGDKNIEFAIADPSSITRQINDSARPPIVKVAAQEYCSPPPRAAGESAYADRELCALFGIDLEKTAGVMALPGGGEMPMGDPAQTVQAAQQQVQGPVGGGMMSGRADLTDPSSFLNSMPASEKALEKGMEFADATMAQARERRDPESFMKVLDAVKTTAKMMFPEAELKKQQAKGLAGPPGMQQQPPPGIDPTTMKMAQFGVPPYEDPFLQQMQAPEAMLQNFNPPDFAEGGTPPNVGGGLQQFGLPDQFTSQFAEQPFQQQFPKFGSAREQPKPVSLVMVKAAARAKEQRYPLAHPDRELLDMKAALEKEASELNELRDRTDFMQKEALSSFSHEVRQHLLSGGGIGELVHALGGLADEGTVKTAMAAVVPDLVRDRFNLVQLQADMIRYEMEKGASSRCVNPDNELVRSFAAYAGARIDLDTFEKAAAEATKLLGEANELLGAVLLAKAQ